MKTVTLTTENVLASLERAIDKVGPGYVRPSGHACRYSYSDGTPSCAVGFVLADLAPGVFDKVFEFEQEHDTSLPVEILVQSKLFSSAQVEDPTTLDALVHIQKAFDQRSTLRDAVSAGKIRIEMGVKPA